MQLNCIIRKRKIIVVRASCPRRTYKLNTQQLNYVAAPTIKDRFLSEVLALSKAHSLAVPHPDAIAASETISFFQAIQASLRKLEGGGDGSGRVSNQDIETAIRQVVDQALVSDAAIRVKY